MTVTEMEWERLRADAGPIPAETCPVLDRLRKAVIAIERLVSHEGRAFNNKESLANAVASEVRGLEDEIQEVRQANARLRSLGVYWHEIAENLATETEFEAEAA